MGLVKPLGLGILGQEKELRETKIISVADLVDRA